MNVISSLPLYSVEINLRLPMYSLHIASSTVVKQYFCMLDGWLNDMADDQIIMKKNWKELKGQCYVANRLNEQRIFLLPPNSGKSIRIYTRRQAGATSVSY